MVNRRNRRTEVLWAKPGGYGEVFVVVDGAGGGLHKPDFACGDHPVLGHLVLKDLCCFVVEATETYSTEGFLMVVNY
jgi:hypothetical protein